VILRILIVGAGGFIGAVSRYALSGLVHRLTGSTFPVGTLAVNVAGCFLLGALMQLVTVDGAFAPNARLFLTIGMLGAFTTFSTFGYETLALLDAGDFLHAGLNVLYNVALGLLAVWLGRMAMEIAGF
jgi:CrcB protein